VIRSLSIVSLLAAVCVLAGAAYPTSPEESKLPMVEGRKALATVNGDPVTLDEFLEQLGLLHQGIQEPGAKIHRQEPYDLLDRLINIKLILQEARNIGLNEVPEVKKALATYRREAMGMILLGKRSRTITAPDPAEVRKIYEASAREAKLTSFLIAKEDDAAALESQMKAGGSYDALTKALVDAGKARPGDQGVWLRTSEMLPQIREAVTGTKPGGVGPRVKVAGGFVVFRLEEVRAAEDEGARREAERQALDQKRSNALRAYTDDLVKKYAKIDEPLFGRLDYETAKGFDPYLKDGRTLARVEGEPPVTVRDYSEALLSKYYHGVEKAIAQKKVNARKREVLDEVLGKRVILAEAKRQGIARTPEYKTTVKEYEDGVLFGVFVERVIDPDIKLGDPELRRYLSAHASEYASPEMMRLDGLAFDKRPRAEDALGKLRKGADFAWMRANAAGQIAPASTDGLLQFDPHPVVTSSLPSGLRKALNGAVAGDYRLFGDGNGPFYVVFVRDIVPSQPQPYEEVKGGLQKKAFEEKREEAVLEWAKKLRSAYTVKTYVTRQSLGAILGMGPAAKGA